ncbi:MAG: VPDSG-CTERM sorting domain-containing protein [Acidobacteria bacterium]|nr:VPDSG-CTERM sorting domain-containing protein [Acidobacteriota bacterium]
MLVIVTALLVLTTSAWADLTGDVYRIPGNLMNAGPLSGFGTHTLVGSFTASEINFFVAGPQGSSGTLGQFLGYVPGNVTYTPNGVNSALTDVMSNCPDSASSCIATAYSTLIVITGSQFFAHGASYTVTHDDGMVMTVDGNPFINAPTPVSPTPTTQTYNGTSGVYGYEIDYIATNGNPEVLQSTSVGVPDGGMTLTLLGGALVGLETLRRRLRV